MNQSNGSSDRRFCFTCLLCSLALVVLALAGIRTISSGSLFSHLAVGRWIAANGIPRVDALSFTAAGAPWINTTWLYDRLLAGFWGIGGAGLVTILHVLLVVGAFLALIPVARRWAGSAATALALLLSTWLLAPRFTVGPYAVGLLMAALYVNVLSSERKSWVPWAVLLPLQVLWTNLHGSFLLGPAILAIFAVDAAVRERMQGTLESEDGRSRVAALACLAVAAVFISLLNPYHIRLPLRVMSGASNVAFNFVQEWVSSISSQFSASAYAKHAVTFALLVGAGGLIAERRKLPISLTALAVISAFLAVRSLRYVEVLAVFAFPFFALSFDAMGKAIAKMVSGLVPVLNKVLPAVIVLLLVLTAGAFVSNAYYCASGSFSTFGLGVNDSAFPSAPDVLGRADFPARMVNLPGDGGYLLWNNPDRQVFIDQRADVYGVELFQTLNQCLAGVDGAWATVEEKWEPGAVVLNCSVSGAGTAIRTLLIGKRWELVYFDGSTAILVRDSSANVALLGNVELQTAGLKLIEQERQRYASALREGKRSGVVSPRLIGAGNIFLALGRYPEAEVIYSLLVNGLPAMGQAWLNLGICQLQLQRADAAIGTLSKATEMMPKNAAAWLYLGEAYRAKGMEQPAKSCYDRAQSLNAGLVNAYVRGKTQDKGAK